MASGISNLMLLADAALQQQQRHNNSGVWRAQNDVFHSSFCSTTASLSQNAQIAVNAGFSNARALSTHDYISQSDSDVLVNAIHGYYSRLDSVVDDDSLEHSYAVPGVPNIILPDNTLDSTELISESTEALIQQYLHVDVAENENRCSINPAAQTGPIDQDVFEEVVLTSGDTEEPEEEQTSLTEVMMADVVETSEEVTYQVEETDFNNLVTYLLLNEEEQGGKNESLQLTSRRPRKQKMSSSHGCGRFVKQLTRVRPEKHKLYEINNNELPTQVAEKQLKFEITGDIKNDDKNSANHPDDARSHCEWLTCTEEFDTPSALAAHVKSAHVEQTRQWVCEWRNCDRKRLYFGERYQLLRHLSRHTQDRAFLCDVCTNTFSTSERLRLHKRAHQGYRPYKCQTCEKTFCSTGERAKHEKIHLPVTKLLKCGVVGCGNEYKSRDALTRHVRVKHHKI